MDDSLNLFGVRAVGDALNLSWARAVDDGLNLSGREQWMMIQICLA
jgi:hypothetical protein